MEWFFAFWAYPEIYYMDDTLSLQIIRNYITNKDTDLAILKYEIDNQPDFCTDYEREFRPTEVAALSNLYRRAKYAEVLRARYERSNTD